MTTLIKKITTEMVGKEIVLKGRIVHTRTSGKVAFVELRDGTGFIQCVAEEKNLGAEKFEQFKSLNIESSLSITGTISKHPKKNEYEIQVSNFSVYTATKDYPLGQKEHNPEFLFDNRHLHIRAKSQIAIQRVRDTIIHATYDRFRNNDFIKIDAPIFTPNACEGTTELYEVEHVNGKKMYLTQSGQLYLEAAVMAHGRVYDFGPAFRAEECKTRRHLNEMRMMDAEIAFAEQKENMEIQEQLVYFIIQEVLRVNRKDLELIEAPIEQLENITLPFKRVMYKDRVDELIAMGFDVKQGDDIGSDLEMQYCQKQSQPIFLTNFPMGFKAFYFKEDPQNPGTVLGADLLAPGDCGEVIGGGTREDNYDKLLANIKKHNLPLEYFERLLDTRKYGGVPHCGFGYGLERLVRRLCGLHHIRETIPFPRYANRITP